MIDIYASSVTSNSTYELSWFELVVKVQVIVAPVFRSKAIESHNCCKRTNFSFRIDKDLID